MRKWVEVIQPPISDRVERSTLCHPYAHIDASPSVTSGRNPPFPDHPVDNPSNLTGNFLHNDSGEPGRVPEGCRKGAGRGGVKTLDETTVRGQRRRRGARMKAEKGGVEKGKRKVKGQHVAGQRVSVCPSVFAYGEGAQTADVTEVISLSSPSSFSSPFIPLFFPFLLFSLSLSLPPFRSPCFPSSVSPRRSPICR